MKSRHLLFNLMMGVCFFTSCVQEDLSFLDASESPYADAQVSEAVASQITVRVDQKYRTVDIALDGLGVSLEDDAVFYAACRDGEDWCGEGRYTSEYGFYIDADGYACYRSSADAKLFVEFHPEGNGTGSRLSIGQIPDACMPGDRYTVNVGFATVQSKQPIKIEVTVSEALPWATYMEHEDGLTYTVYQEVNTDYTALEIPVNEPAVKKALGLDSLQPLLDAMQGDTAYDTTMRGLNSDGSSSSYGKYTANVAGYWFNQNGDVCEWKDEGWGAFIEWDRTSPMIFRLGQAVENNVAGSRYDMKIALVCNDKEAVLTFKLKIVPEVTEDLGLL